MDGVRALLGERIAEIDAERKRLQAALGELSGLRGRSQRRTSATARQTARRQPKSSRAKPGERRRQILAHLERNPDARAAEIAEAIKASPKHVHSLLAKLRAEKLISRRGKGYRLSARAGSVAKPKRSGSTRSAKATAAKTKGPQGKAGARPAQRKPTTAARRRSAKKVGSKSTAPAGAPRPSTRS